MSVPKEIREKGLLSIGDVARLMGVHRATVWNWIKQGKLRATTPTVPSESDPGALVPVSERYRGVAKADLAVWRKVYPSQVDSVRKSRRSPSKKMRANKRAKRAQTRR